MALLIFFSSLGLSLDVHFCQGKFKRANLFGVAKTCQEVKDCLVKCGQQKTSCHTDRTCSKEDTHKGCCSNSSFEFDLDLDVFEVIQIEINKIQKQFLTTCTYTYGFNLESSKDVSRTRLYVPPQLDKQFAVLFQVFRL